MSRAHYERELHNTMEEARRSKAKGPPTDCPSALRQVFHVLMFVSWMFFPQRSPCSLCLLAMRSCRTWHHSPRSRSVIVSYQTGTSLFVPNPHFTWLNFNILSGSALGPAHVWHDRERVGADRGAHRGQESLDSWMHQQLTNHVFQVVSKTVCITCQK